MPLLDRRRFSLASAAAMLAAHRLNAGTLAAGPAANQPLIDLLDMVPAGAFDPAATTGQIASFADIAGQLTAVGATSPKDFADSDAVHAWETAIQALALPASSQQAFNPEWKTAFGFEFLDIDQSLEFGQPPLILTFYRGRFKPGDIGAALKASGYKPVAASGAVVWSLSEDESISLDKPANQLALSRMNNVALVGSDLMLASPRLDALQAILETIAGGQPAAAANDELSMVLDATTVRLASCFLLNGDAITGQPGPVTMFIAGVNFGLGSPAGGPTSSSGKPAASPAKWELTLLTKTASDAQALAKSIDLGLQTGVMLNSRKPYHEVISDWKIAVDSKNPIVTAELTFAADTPPGVWRNLIAQRDLGFLAGS